MESSILKQAGKLLREQKKNRQRTVVFLSLAVGVCMGTFGLLHLQGQAQTHVERRLSCAYVPHVHGENCYTENGQGERSLSCRLADYAVHVHNDDCYDAEGTLVCPLPVNEKHVHTDECFQETQLLVCGLEESAGHQHQEECFVPEQGELLCVLPEHAHSEQCAGEDGTISCGLSEHTHEEACWDWRDVLICELPEEAGHVHGEACFQTERTLCCGKLELHEHEQQTCYEENGDGSLVLVCEKTVLEEHIHGEECFQTVELSREEVAELYPAQGPGADVPEDDDGSFLQELEGGEDLSETASAKDALDKTAADEEPLNGTDGDILDGAAVDEDALEGTVMDEDTPEGTSEGEDALEGTVMDEDTPEGTAVGEDSPEGTPADEDSPEGAVMDEDSLEGIVMDEDTPEGTSAAGDSFKKDSQEAVPATGVSGNTASAGNKRTEPAGDGEEITLVAECRDYILTFRALASSLPETTGKLTLRVRELEQDSEEYRQACETMRSRLGESAANQKFFDFALMDGGAEIEPVGPVTVVFQPKAGSTVGVDLDDPKIYHVDPGLDRIDDMKAVADEDGGLRMETDHFSIFAVASVPSELLDKEREPESAAAGASIESGQEASGEDAGDGVPAGNDTDAGESSGDSMDADDLSGDSMDADGLSGDSMDADGLSRDDMDADGLSGDDAGADESSRNDGNADGSSGEGADSVGGSETDSRAGDPAGDGNAEAAGTENPGTDEPETESQGEDAPISGGGYFVILQSAPGTISNEWELQMAFDNGGSYTLEASFLTNSSFNITKDVSIDLNGNIITYTGKDYLFCSTNNRTLRITDNSRWNNDTPGSGGSGLWGNQADINGDTLTYYVSESTAQVTGTRERLVQHTANLSGLGGLIGQNAPDTLIKVSNGGLAVSGGRFQNMGGEHCISGGNNVWITLSGKSYLLGGCADGDSSAKQNGVLKYGGGGIFLKNVTAYSGHEAALIMDGGVIAGNSAYWGGGICAVGAGSTVLLRGGVISGNTALDNTSKYHYDVYYAGSYPQDLECHEGGAGVFVQHAKLSIEGGYITNNVSYDRYQQYYNSSGMSASQVACLAYHWGMSGGGGVATDGSPVTMTGGYITGNKAAMGGGIHVSGYLGDWGPAWNTQPLSITGGTIASNCATESEGGGLRVGQNINAAIQTNGKVYITNNRCDTNIDWGGGGVFVSENASLLLENALIYSNSAGGFGGGMAGCATGELYVISGSKGVAVFGNRVDGKNLTAPYATKPQDHLAAENTTFRSNGYQDYFCAQRSTVSNRMLGGGLANWQGSADYKPVEAKELDAVLTAGRMMGLTARPSDADRRIAMSAGMTNVILTGNYSAIHGGAIMCNGVLTVEDKAQMKMPTSLTVNLKKSFENGTLRDNQFEFVLLNCAKLMQALDVDPSGVSELNFTKFQYNAAGVLCYDGKDVSGCVTDSAWSDAKGNVTLHGITIGEEASGSTGDGSAEEDQKHRYWLVEIRTNSPEVSEWSNEAYLINVSALPDDQNSRQQTINGKSVVIIDHYVDKVTVGARKIDPNTGKAVPQVKAGSDKNYVAVSHENPKQGWLSSSDLGKLSDYPKKDENGNETEWGREGLHPSITIGGEYWNAFVNNGKTATKFRLYKINSLDQNAIAGAEFSLYHLEEDGTQGGFISKSTSSVQGYVEFSVEDGGYLLAETRPPQDREYLKAGPWIVCVNGTGVELHTAVEKESGKYFVESGIESKSYSDDDGTNFEYFQIENTPKQYTSLNLRKVSSTEGIGALTGAVFTLQRLTAEETPDPEAEVLERTCGADGVAVFDSLEYPGIYLLTEKKAPEGYAARGPWYLEAGDDGKFAFYLVNRNNERYTKGSEDKMNEALPEEGNTVFYQIPNDALYELPETGGPGVLPYILGGLMLLAAAGGLLLGKRRAGRVLTVLLLLCACAAAGWQNVSAAADPSRPCSLTVTPGPEEFLEDLAEAEVVFDLYRVADLLPLTGSDGFSFAPLEAYRGLEFSEDADAAGWRALARQAAEIALQEDAGAPVLTGAPADVPVDGITPGLYLLIARGEDLENPITEIVDEDGRGVPATAAYSRAYKYTFAPELVALPTKPADENGYVGTDSPGEWLYEVDAALKPERSERYGTLVITKSLDSYETQDSATFVFRVDAYTDEGMAELVYSDVVSLTFTEPGVRETLVEGRIPAGSYVVVTEVYSGASYRLTTPAEQAVTVSAEEAAQVRFSNTYDGNRRGGSGIANTFTYGEGQWQWTAGEE